MSLLPVEAALDRILARVPPVETEVVALTEANGRVLAAPLVATHDQPPFDASAMDGYAVRAADVTPGVPLRMIGTSQAGAGFAGTVAPGECARIFTGAPVPAGADAVIMQEEATPGPDGVSFASRPEPGRSIRPRGNDFRVGQTLLEAGAVLGPFSLAMAAAANAASLSVARRPRVAVLATGDELVLPGAELGPDRIAASNSFGLIPLLAPYSGEIADLGIAPDRPDRLKAMIADAFERGVDVLVTTGGASVGEHDIVQDVLKDLGVTLDFWRINMRPGKPLMFGTHGRTLVFGLPGNPVSAMVTATVFIKPALRRWLGADAMGTQLRLPLAAATPPNTARRHFMRATIETGPTGVSAVRPIAETDSGHTSSLARADALIVQPENDPGQAAGALAEVIPLGAF